MGIYGDEISGFFHLVLHGLCSDGLFYFALLSGILIPSIIAILKGHLKNIYNLISKNCFTVAGPTKFQSTAIGPQSQQGVRGGWL